MLMKKIYTILWALTISVSMMAQGWPEKYEGVMLQGFYWDSYTDSKWTNLESQADELSQYFKLIWVPNSGKTSDFHHTGRKTMGYDPCYWFDHTGAFGTEAELRSMISTISPMRPRGHIVSHGTTPISLEFARTMNVTVI